VNADTDEKVGIMLLSFRCIILIIWSYHVIWRHCAHDRFPQWNNMVVSVCFWLDCPQPFATADINEYIGPDIEQEGIYQLLTTVTRVPFQVGQCGFCGGQNDVEASLYSPLRLSPPFPSSIPLCWSVIRGWYNGPRLANYQYAVSPFPKSSRYQYAGLVFIVNHS
jgi:hypothetical protein